jgi:hypothetical protein
VRVLVDRQVADGVVAWVEGAMGSDRKVTALKTLQVGRQGLGPPGQRREGRSNSDL